MSPVKIFTFAFVILLTSCQTSEVFVMPDEESQSKGRMLAIASYNKSFLNDFLVAPSGAKVPAKKYFRDIQNSREESVEQLHTTYPSAKAVLVDLSDEANTLEGKNDLIQIIALPYMRNLFLSADIESNNRELAELLTIVMPTNPIDLDVLVDAFIASRDYLTVDQQAEYNSYFSTTYYRQNEEVKAAFPVAKERFENASTNDEKYSAIIVGKKIERISKSLAYSKEKLGIVPRSAAE